jgi:hypothetical protein
VDVIAKIYWLRVSLGVIAGLISTGVLMLWPLVDSSVTLRDLVAPSNGAAPINTLLNGITIALFIYLISYYVVKAKYTSQVEKPSKIMSMGIFIYFFTWIIVWVLSLSLLIGPL